jgi:hypothetical protein
MIFAIRGGMILFVAALSSTVGASALASQTRSPRFCLSIAIDLRDDRREEVSAVDLVIQNASVVSIPRFPLGWGIKVQNYVDNTPTTISGGATGNVAELRSQDLRCLFEIENGVPGTPPIEVTGSINISNGQTEQRLILRKDQIIFKKLPIE